MLTHFGTHSADFLEKDWLEIHSYHWVISLYFFCNDLCLLRTSRNNNMPGFGAAGDFILRFGAAKKACASAELTCPIDCTL